MNRKSCMVSNFEALDLWTQQVDVTYTSRKVAASAMASMLDCRMQNANSGRDGNFKFCGSPRTDLWQKPLLLSVWRGRQRRTCGYVASHRHIRADNTDRRSELKDHAPWASWPLFPNGSAVHITMSEQWALDPGVCMQSLVSTANRPCCS